MHIVTYRGPEDPQDPTNQYAIEDAEGSTFYFPLDVPLEVSDELARSVGEQEGHTFEVTTSAKGGAKKDDPSGKSGESKGD